MSLSAGDRLGRFEIVSSLGAGGMGEVYRARDLQLERHVAIKVLPNAFQHDPGRRRRFELEARAASRLNHPHILAVHDIGVDGASPYIVTELLEGETLRDRIGGRPMPARKAVEYALQIASGLAAGHERGIVHRDIKPQNLFVTTENRIKILDFGLAKLLDTEHADVTETITVTGDQRRPVLGTAAYMSPEQARGLRIDPRTDIFSFGAVLHEMLTGAPAFRRATTTDTLDAILHGDPPPLPRGPDINPALERIVLHCLEKKPDERFQNVRDLMFALESLPASGTLAAARAHGRPWRIVSIAAAVLTMLGIGAAGYLIAARPAPDAEARTFHRVRPMTDFSGLEEFPAISPDGRQLATAARGEYRQLFVRLIAGGPPLPLTTDDGDHQEPRWLPDGSSLICFVPGARGEVQGAIHSVPALGGASRRIIDSLGGGDVNRAGRVATFRVERDVIQLVTATLDGSTIEVVHQFDDARALYHRSPRWSPDGQGIAFQRGDGLRWDIFIVPAGGGELRQLTRDQNLIRGLAWHPDGARLLYSVSRGTTIPYLPPCPCGKCVWIPLTIRRGSSRRMKPGTSSRTSIRAASSRRRGCRWNSMSGGIRWTGRRRITWRAGCN